MSKSQTSAHKMSRRSTLAFLGKAAIAIAVATGAALSATSALVSTARAQEAVFEGRDKWLFPGWEKIDVVDKAKVDNVIDLIDFTNKELAKRNIGLVVVVVPAKALIHQDKLPEGKTLSSDVLGLYANILRDLATKGIATVDLMPVLKALPQDQDAFFRTDYHWTAWASEAAAKATADLINSKWKLSGQAGDGAKLAEWTKERRFGDLAANFMTPEQRAAIGREVFTVRKQGGAEGEGLLDEAKAPVHVVGNSFTAPYLGFSQALSHDLDRAVTLTWNPGDVGPWATMIQYLESDSFRQNPPQVIVWQFNEGQMQQSPSAEGLWAQSSIMPDAEWKKKVEASLAQ